MKRLPAFLLVCFSLVCGYLFWPARADEAPGRLLFRFKDPEITESSGLAASRRYPGLIWTNNDSGDSARLFLANAQGTTVARYAIDGATNFDWEDIAIAGSGSEARLYIGDIGDNKAIRRALPIFRVPEPDLDPAAENQQITSARAERMLVRFPDGPRDAETLLAQPDGRLLILSKSETGTSRLYRTPNAFKDGDDQTMELVCELTFQGEKFAHLPTAGDFSPDGTRLAICTYRDLYQWVLPAPYDVSKLGETVPAVSSLPALKQCEGLCYSATGDKILVSTEGKDSPVWELSAQAP